MQRNLLLKGIQVLCRTFVVFGNDFVAGAVIADRLTKRHVHIERQRREAPHRAHPIGARPQCLPIVPACERLDKTVGSGVGRVTRTGDIKLPQQCFCELGFGRENSGRCHSGNVPKVAISRLDLRQVQWPRRHPKSARSTGFASFALFGAALTARLATANMHWLRMLCPPQTAKTEFNRDKNFVRAEPVEARAHLRDSP